MKRTLLIKTTFFFAFAVLFMSCNKTKPPKEDAMPDTMATTNSAMNVLSDQEKQEGWELLFDGKTLNGWHSFNKPAVGSKWKVDDNAIMLEPKTDTSAHVEDSDITSDSEYGDFELRVDWKIDTCGNSGIIYRSVESEKYQTSWSTGIEMQVLDNACHPDAKIEKHRAGDLYDVIKSSEEPVKPALEWNEVRIIAKGNHVEHWLNGKKVIDTEMGTDAWKKLIAASKWKDYPDFGTAKQGHIVLQEHGSRVWYRNIKIKKLG